MTKNLLSMIGFVAIYLSACSQPAVENKDDQIAQAVMAAPESDRADATVYGFDSKGQRVLLRQGTNTLICVSDDPGRDGFQCVCYHTDLEPFMQRGRELRAQGMNFKEVFDAREKEAKEGSLQMPKDGSTLHLLEGPDGRFDSATGEVVDANYRYVVYIPWATAESTGLPLKPMVPGGPWIMDPGTHRAHIMITPPKPSDQ